MRMTIPHLKSLTCLVLAPILFTACKATQPGSASFASVVIATHTADEIRQTTHQVFAEAGYVPGFDENAGMTFEKEGSRANAIAHGGLYATQQGAETWVRVKVNLVPLKPGSFRLQCRAYMVPRHGDAFFEEEHALPNFRGRPYQELLDEVARKLK